MHVQSVIACVCTLFTVTGFAAPHLQKRTFTVERVPNPNFTGRNGPAALAKAYRKFGMALPEGFMSKREISEELFDRDGGHHNGGSRRKGGRHGNQDDDDGDDSDNGDDGDNNSDNGDNGDDGDDGDNGDEGDNSDNGDNGDDGGNSDNSNNGGNSSNSNSSNNGGNNNNNGTTGAQGQAGSVAATPERNDAEFISPITVGGQTMNIDFDTGSSDLWVFNTNLGAASTAGHHVFDPTKSKTFKEMSGAQFTISYGDGSGASGIVGTDTVSVGGVSFASQAVELATQVSQTFVQDQTSDGLMGLAFSKINTVKPQPQNTFLDNVKSSLAEPVFTADLRSNSPGTYTFGSIDNSKFQGALAWVPVNNAQGFWQFGSEKFAVGGGQTQEATAGGQAIADTGTSLILADQKIVTAYYAQVQGAQNDAQQGGFIFPCNAKLPDLALDVGGVYMATVSGSDMIFAELGDGNCFGGVQATPQGQLGIYGDVFFKSQFVAFNAGNNSLGMAPHA